MNATKSTVCLGRPHHVVRSQADLKHLFVEFYSSAVLLCLDVTLRERQVRLTRRSMTACGRSAPAPKSCEIDKREQRPWG